MCACVRARARVCVRACVRACVRVCVCVFCVCMCVCGGVGCGGGGVICSIRGTCPEHAHARTHIFDPILIYGIQSQPMIHLFLNSSGIYQSSFDEGGKMCAPPKNKNKKTTTTHTHTHTPKTHTHKKEHTQERTLRLCSSGRGEYLLERGARAEAVLSD